VCVSPALERFNARKRGSVTDHITGKLHSTLARMISPNRWPGVAIFATVAAQKSPPFATGQVQGEKRRKSFAASQA
jgi:hypothetical protein